MPGKEIQAANLKKVTITRMIKKKKSGAVSVEETKRSYFTRKIREWGKDHFIHYPWRTEENIFKLLLTEIFLQKTDSLKIRDIYPLINSIDSPGLLLQQEELLDQIVSQIGLHYKKQRIIRLCGQLVHEFGSEVPGSYEDLRRLHGVGDYIASALLSFGFKQKAALVDTNTVRIIECFFGYRSKSKRPRDDRSVYNFLLSVLPSRNCPIFNYYLLDFGAVVCTKKKKHCPVCILKRKCSLYQG